MKTPLFIFTGFLGSGKTTLIAQLLRRPGPRTAVLINELGAISLDHHLVEQVDEELSVLSSGCICCTLRGELSLRLERVLELGPERVVLETTGLANPAPILHALQSHPRLSQRLRLGATVVALDALRSGPLLDRHAEARAQLALADRAVLTKIDLASPDQLEALEQRVAQEAPGAEVLRAAHGEVEAGALLGEAPLGQLKDRRVAERWLHHHHEAEVRTELLELESPVNAEALFLWLRLVTQLDGPRLLRIKGIVQDAQGRALLFQSAEHAVAPVRVLPGLPRGWMGSRLVVISRGLSEAVMGRMLEAARSAAVGRLLSAETPPLRQG